MTQTDPSATQTPASAGWASTSWPLFLPPWGGLTGQRRHHRDKSKQATSGAEPRGPTVFLFKMPGSRPPPTTEPAENGTHSRGWAAASREEGICCPGKAVSLPGYGRRGD